MIRIENNHITPTTTISKAMFPVSNKRKFDTYNISSAITVDYTGFDAFPASSPGNWPILKNGDDSTWRQALSEILANKAEEAGNNTIFNNNTTTNLHNEWILDEVAEMWSSLYMDLSVENEDKINALKNSEEYNKVFAVWLVHSIPVYKSNTIDNKIMDHFEEAFHNGHLRFEEAIRNGYRHPSPKMIISKPLENYDWLAEVKEIMEQPNQTIYNVYNVMWNHPDIEIKKYFRSDISEWW
jgi:hypothetical protein